MKHIILTEAQEPGWLVVHYHGFYPQEFFVKLWEDKLWTMRVKGLVKLMGKMENGKQLKRLWVRKFYAESVDLLVGDLETEMNITEVRHFKKNNGQLDLFQFSPRGENSAKEVNRIW